MGITVYRHYTIDGYPNNISLIVSEEGFGRNDYIETTKPLVIVTAPGPGSGKDVYKRQVSGCAAALPFP